MKNPPPYKSKLIPHQKKIFRMWSKRKTLKEIQAFLKTQDVLISCQGISIFIRRRNKRPDPHYIADHLQHLMDDDKTKTPEDDTVTKIPTPQEWIAMKAKKKEKSIKV